MINRTLVRTKVIQTLFAFYKDGEKSSLTARKELLKSFSDTYSLYMLMLAFSDELVRCAEEHIEENKTRAAITHQAYTPNRKFVNSTVAQQLFNNARLRNYLNEQHLYWDAAHGSIQAIYKQLLEAPYYAEYMALEDPTYEDDKQLWRKIYGSLLLNNSELASALEELEVVLDYQNWTTDVDLVLTYVVKTIKRFKKDNGDTQELLEMFDSEAEFLFAKDLLRLAIEHADEYKEKIVAAAQNWEAERIAYMDTIILLTAITEIIHFNEIALEISMNEYIELSKEYSSEKSYTFINGILNKVVKDLRQEGKLFKVVR